MNLKSKKSKLTQNLEDDEVRELVGIPEEIVLDLMDGDGVDARTSTSREYGRPRSLDIPNEMQVWLNSWPKTLDPCVVSIVTEGKIPGYSVMSDLLADGWEVKWQNSLYCTKQYERISYVILVNQKYPEYMLKISFDWVPSSQKRKKNYKKKKVALIPGTLPPHKDYKLTEADEIKISDAQLYTPVRSSSKWNEQIPLSIIKIMEKYEVQEDAEEAAVNIVTIVDGDYDIREFSLEDAKTNFIFPDLHYGDNFEKFHDDLVKRMEEESKGLVLFHGAPGTGKTQYIRHLLKELCKANKAVLYAPPSVSASLAEPDMINFISDWIMGESRDCILLIEDAEPLLESRNGGADGRSTGISNLLNITDGILNDILGLMVIATFNIEISKIDQALLRPGRLIARKEFHKLHEEQVEELAKALGMEIPENAVYPITLAEFYNSGKSKKILTHNYEESKPHIGFRK